MARRRTPPRGRRPSSPGASVAGMSRRVEAGPDGYEYEIRAIAAARAVKTYRCPGCDHEIRSGTSHVVVWRADLPTADERRHWHTPCWANRKNRAPTRKWS